MSTVPQGAFEPNPKGTVLISPQTVFMIFGLVVGVWLLVQIREVVVLVFIAWLLASTLYPAVAWLEQRKFPRALGIGLFYLLFLVALAGLVILMGDMLIHQIIQLINDFPSIVDRVSEQVSRIPGIRKDFRLEAWIVDNARAMSTNARILVVSVLEYVFSFLSGFVSGFTVLVLTFLMLMRPRHLERGLVRFFPRYLQARTGAFMETVSQNVGLYIRGQVMVAGIIACLTGLGLSVLGIDYALILALLAFVLDFIPVLGSLIAAIFAVLVALGQDPMLALWTVILYVIVNQLEANLVGPMIIGKAVGLSPFWIIFSILAGAALAGIAGAFLAIPVAVIIKLVIDEFYVQDFLNGSKGSPIVVPGEQETGPVGSVET